MNKYRLRFISALDGQPYESDFSSLVAVFEAMLWAHKRPPQWELYRLGVDDRGLSYEQSLVETSDMGEPLVDADAPPRMEMLDAAFSPYSLEWEEEQQAAGF